MKDVNPVLSRLSEVLELQAELLKEMGRLLEPLEHLNQKRNKSFKGGIQISVSGEIKRRRTSFVGGP